MKHPRKSPHIIVLDGTWESLPNPPFMSPNPPFMNPLYQPRVMVTALLKNRYILVTSYIDSLFYIYQIFSRIWSPAPPVPNLSKVDFHLAPYKIKSVSVDDMLYRISFDHVGCYTKHLVIQAFKLSLDQWFEGCLNVGSEIFGECNEVLEDEYPCCGLFLHRGWQWQWRF